MRGSFLGSPYRRTTPSWIDKRLELSSELRPVPLRDAGVVGSSAEQERAPALVAFQEHLLECERHGSRAAAACGGLARVATQDRNSHLGYASVDAFVER